MSLNLVIRIILLVVVVNGLDCDSDPTSTFPMGIHLAFGQNPTQDITVSFFTCSITSNKETPLIHLFGPKNNQTFTGTTLSNKGEGRFHHHVAMKNLSSDTTYHYTASLSDSKSPRSRPYQFRTASSSPKEYFTVAVVGDMGVNGSSSTISWLSTKRTLPTYNATIHLGDVSYADDYDKHLVPEPSSGRSYEAVYDDFLTTVENISATSPYHIVPGNHDVTCHATTDLGCASYQKNFSAINRRYRMPGYDRRGGHNMWYSFDLGSVHFAMIDTESDYPSAPTKPHTFIGGGAGGGFNGNQLKWLTQDLKDANARTEIEWIVVSGHRPWYSSKTMDWPLRTPTHLRNAFEKILVENNVDMYLCGHKHFYERTKKIVDGKVDLIKGIVYVTNGAAGNNEGVQKKGNGNKDLIETGQYAASGTGFGELATMEGGDGSGGGMVLRWRYRLSKDGSVVDELILPARGKRKKKKKKKIRGNRMHIEGK